MNEFLIRSATPQDLPAIHKINEAFIPKVISVSLSWLQEYYPQTASFLVCETKMGVSAFVMAMTSGLNYPSENYRWFQKNYPQSLYVDRIAVDQEAHGLGMGRALYQTLEKQWKSKATSISCEVNVNPPNPDSYAFHKKLGFTEVAQQDTKNGTIRVAMLIKDL